MKLRIENFAALTDHEINALIRRQTLDLQAVQENVIKPMSTAFKQNSKQALTNALQSIDGFVAEPLVHSQSALKDAYLRAEKTHSPTIAAFRLAQQNIRKFHELQIQKDFEAEIAGNTLGMKFVPFDRVALYVPGGKALYPSTVLMGVTPAKLAGVADITVFTPPHPETQRVDDIVLAMAHLAGATRVVAAGGAQAIFAAAHGVTELNLKNADFVYGPGNIYVSAAKVQVSSENLCGIDSFAGPSEVVVIADDSANARYVAHDLMAQAEHDENAQAILLTTSRDLAKEVEREIISSLDRRADDEKRKQITLASIERNGRVLVMNSLEEAMDFSNAYAPEHLEIQTRDNERMLSLVRAAGSVFIGDHAPVAAGDYYSGTNHILPTMNGARYASGVSAYTFYRRITWQRLTPSGLERGRDAITEMSKAEGLFAEHGYSVLTRFEK